MSRYSGRAWRQFDPTQTQSAAQTLSSRDPCLVLGLDPGSIRTGYGLVEFSGQIERHVASGCVRPRSSVMVDRLREIFEVITELVERYQPHEVAIERVFVHRNPDSALKLGQARGVALCAAVTLSAPVFEYAPRMIKQSVVGTGTADKTQVSHMIQALLKVPKPLSADASDALAACLCHGQARRVLMLQAKGLEQ